jgi:NADH-quinone oxidoreductase subunit C
VYPINQERDNLVISKLTDKFGETILGHEQLADMLCVTITKESVLDIMQFLHEDQELQYNFLTTLCGMHYPETNQLGVVYHLHSFTSNHRIRIKTTTEIEKPYISSITSIWPAANWQERETYDFFGIIFEGHPNLTRILNVDDMTVFPMRKDFPLEDQTREDKDDSMFGR